MTNEKAISTIENAKNFAYDDVYQEAFDMAIKALKEQRRIPINEQLPNIHNYSEFYLVTLSNGEVTEVMFTETNGKSWWERTRYKIIAWMPLPQSYREVEE